MANKADALSAFDHVRERLDFAERMFHRGVRAVEEVEAELARIMADSDLKALFQGLLDASPKSMKGLTSEVKAARGVADAVLAVFPKPELPAG